MRQIGLVRDHERRIDLSVLNPSQKVAGPARHVRLCHAEGQALVHRLAHRDLVDETGVDADDGDDARRAADVDHLAQHVRAVVLSQQHLLCAVEDRIGLAEIDVALGPDRVDAPVRALAVPWSARPTKRFRPHHEQMAEVEKQKRAANGRVWATP